MGKEATTEKTTKTIKIDHDLCIGCGSCESICSAHFELKDDGLAYVKAQYKEEDKDDIESAKESCPVGAISVE